MKHFEHEGFRLAFIDQPPADGFADPILLIHGFASNVAVNWANPGWVNDLTRAGFRVIAFDHRGHGKSSASYEPADYTPSKMAGDAVALLDHLDIGRAHVMGYSMGARVATFMALEYPDYVATLILGGLGLGMIEGVGDWDPIAAALRVPDASTIVHPRGRMFRAFADQTRSDRMALAACIETSRELVTPAEMARVTQPSLVVAGTKDDIAGSPHRLADLMPDAEAFDVEGRDHMLAVGDRTFKKKAIAFLNDHPL